MKKFLFNKLAGKLRLGTEVVVSRQSKISPEVLVIDSAGMSEHKVDFHRTFQKTDMHKWLCESSGYHLSYALDDHHDVNFNMANMYQPLFYRIRIKSIRFLDPHDAVAFRLTF